MLKPYKAVAVASAFSMLLGGCATGGDPNAPRTALDRSVGQCVASIAAGALLGALLGAATGSRNAGKGAAIGAGAGTVACAVIIAMNNKEDRERLQQSRLAALKSGADDTTRYVGTDGNSRVIHTSVQTVPVPSAPKPAAATASNVTGPAGARRCRSLCRTKAPRRSILNWSARPRRETGWRWIRRRFEDRGDGHGIR